MELQAYFLVLDDIMDNSYTRRGQPCWLRLSKLSVKRYTMERLVGVYKCYCLKCTNALLNDDDFEWIPGRELRRLYDKYFMFCYRSKGFLVISYWIACYSKNF